MTQLVWLRNDLRCSDNPALLAADQATGDIIVVAGIANTTAKRHHRGDRQLQFIQDRLFHLAHELATLNIPLIRLESDTFQKQIEEVLSLASTHRSHAIYINEEYPLDERQRDRDLERLSPIPVYRYEDQCMIPPGTLKTGQGSFYSVFTPFKRRWLAQLQQQPSLPGAKPKGNPALPSAPSSWSSQPNPAFPADSVSIEQRLMNWVERVSNYDETRDIPGVDGTSQLSPYLAIGALSPRQIIDALQHAHPNALSDTAGVGTFISEICWRDFYRNLIVEVPRLSMDKPFKLNTLGLPWSNDTEAFERWKAGQTGIPIVDAAMRQLNETGWMHNRCRMITAMFLTKNLFINWRWGEDYFMNQLIDGDLASNNGGWQWSASTGTDAAPYFRIMNPVSQSLKFDPSGDYIRRWVPELTNLDNKSIHEPYAKGPRPGLNYPQPLVDLKQSRQRAIDVFKQHLQETN